MPFPLRHLATLDQALGDQLLVLEADPFAVAHAAPHGYELLAVHEAAYALRSALNRDHSQLASLFERLFHTSPYANSELMLDELERALGEVFTGDQDPPSWARIVLARRSQQCVNSARSRSVRVATTTRPPQTWIALETVREEGGPAALLRCIVETSDGDVHSLVSDSQGQLHLDGIPPGECKVRLPQLADDEWSASAATSPAHQRRELTHVVQQGESLVRIARQHAISDWQQIWEHGANAALRTRRKSPHVLRPGDRLHIPATSVPQVSLATEQRHRVVIKKPTVEISVRLQDRAKRPLANLTYKVLARDIERPGAAPTDGDGVLRERVPVGTDRLVLQFERPRLRFELLIDQLDPAIDGSEHVQSGVDARLHALGFSRGALRDRVAAFQRTHLDRANADGALDEATCRELETQYGV